MAKRRSRERRAVSFRMLAYRIVIVSRVKTRVIWVNGIRPKKKINAERAEETQREQRREQGEKRKAVILGRMTLQRQEKSEGRKRISGGGFCRRPCLLRRPCGVFPEQ